MEEVLFEAEILAFPFGESFWPPYVREGIEIVKVVNLLSKNSTYKREPIKIGFPGEADYRKKFNIEFTPNGDLTNLMI